MKIRLLALLLFVLGGSTLVIGAGPAAAQQGQDIYTNKCAPCHGANGKGDGPMASNFSKHPADFNSPDFWQGDVDKKITDTVTNGKGEMIPVNIAPGELKAVIDYMKSTFKK